jgi:hypothetical protein
MLRGIVRRIKSKFEVEFEWGGGRANEKQRNAGLVYQGFELRLSGGRVLLVE